jgi:hypothetical protein
MDRRKLDIVRLVATLVAVRCVPEVSAAVALAVGARLRL